ncbi:MAG: serine hydrolase domain-containing protein [Sedimentitalea sp.]
MRFLWAVFLCVWAACAPAQDAATITRLEAAFADWLEVNQSGNGTLAITYRGRLVHSAGIGISADTPVEVASLSKAITAVCMADLVNDGLLNWTDTIGQHLGDVFPRMNSRVRDVTLADVLTHASGIGPDSTQRVIPRWLNQGEPRHWDIARQAVRRRQRKDNIGKFVYNNENYAILGQVITEVTGTLYRDACRARVIPTSLYPTAAVSPRFGAYDSLGGWMMSAQDYAKFHARHFGPGSTVATLPRAFPHVALEGNAFYGPGMVWRAFRSSHNFWHFGSLCYVSLGRGAFVVNWVGEWGVVATWDSCQRPEVMTRLEQGLSRAVFVR